MTKFSFQPKSITLTLTSWAILLILASCVLPSLPTPRPTATPSITPTLTPLPPTPTPTATPTLIPSPTPVPAARVADGDQALFNGDLDAALLAFISAGQNSQDPEIRSAALLGMGRAYALAQDYARALDALREAVQTYPDSPHTPAAYFHLGQVYAALARYGEAADAYQNYLARRPGVIDSYVFELRGDALINSGNYSGALTDYQVALASPRASSLFPLQVKVARTYAITGDYATALVMYNDIYTRAQDDYLKAQVDYLMGLAYAAIGQTDNANAAYLDAVDNYPLAYDSYLALINLVEAGYPVDELQRGLVDYYAGQHLVAIAAFDRYLSANPANPATAYYYKGLAFSAAYNYEGAIQQWDVVIQNYAESSLWDNAWEMKGYIQWYFLAQFPEAAQTLLDFVAASPSHPRAAEFLFDAGRVFERNQKLAKATKTWTRVANEYPTSDYAFRSLFQAGIAQYRQEDYPAARDTFQRLLGIAADNSQKASAYLWMGKSLKAQGDAAGAKANFEQAATADPTGYYSVRASEILSQRSPFTPPEAYDLAIDRQAERGEAEAWLRTTFSLPEGTDLGGPGDLWGDGRMRRGAELWSLGLYPEAREEFESLRLALINDPVNTYRLANYFFEIGLYRSAILSARQVLTLAGMDDSASLNAPAYFSHLRFGAYYSDLLIPLSQAYHFHPLFLFSLVRQESFFESFIDSPAGARGLMQIMPATAQSIVDANGWPPNFTLDDLYRPKVSLTLGTDYLADQRDYLENDLYAALAAYNGGPGNALEWRDLANGDLDLFLEIVRFDETRRYIMGIYEMFNIYRMFYGRTP